MALPTRSYEINGEHHAPADFVNYALDMIKARSMLAITATEVSLDQLAARRSNTPQRISFDLKVVEIRHPQDDEFIVCGYMFIKGTDQKQWISIEAKDGKVLFDLLN